MIDISHSTNTDERYLFWKTLYVLTSSLSVAWVGEEPPGNAGDMRDVGFDP